MELLLIGAAVFVAALIARNGALSPPEGSPELPPGPGGPNGGSVFDFAKDNAAKLAGIAAGTVGLITAGTGTTAVAAGSGAAAASTTAASSGGAATTTTAGTGSSGLLISGQGFGAGATGAGLVATVAGGLAVTAGSFFLNRTVFKSDVAGIIGAVNPLYGTGANIGGALAKSFDSALGGTVNAVTQTAAQVAGGLVAFVGALAGTLAAVSVAITFAPVYAVIKLLGIGGEETTRRDPESVRAIYWSDWERTFNKFYAAAGGAVERTGYRLAPTGELDPALLYFVVPFTDGYCQEVNRQAYRAWMNQREGITTRAAWASVGARDGRFATPAPPSAAVSTEGDLPPLLNRHEAAGSRWHFDTASRRSGAAAEVQREGQWSQEEIAAIGAIMANVGGYIAHMKAHPTPELARSTPSIAQGWANVGRNQGRFTGALNVGGAIVAPMLDRVDPNNPEDARWQVYTRVIDWRKVGA